MATPAKAPPDGGGADFYLHVQTRKAGKLKGEATAPGHEDDIVVKRWNWGLSAGSAIGSTQATGRRSYTALTLVKHIDSATTGLMAALATNDEVREARLTLCRPGDGQHPYLTLTLKAARLTSLQHAGDEDGGTMETVTLAFTKVEVEYLKQKGTGLHGGSMTFTDDVGTT